MRSRHDAEFGPAKTSLLGYTEGKKNWIRPLSLFFIFFFPLSFFSEVTSSKARCMSAEKKYNDNLVYDGLRPLTAKAGK